MREDGSTVRKCEAASARSQDKPIAWFDHDPHRVLLPTSTINPTYPLPDYAFASLASPLPFSTKRYPTQVVPFSLSVCVGRRGAVADDIVIVPLSPTP